MTSLLERPPSQTQQCTVPARTPRPARPSQPFRQSWGRREYSREGLSRCGGAADLRRVPESSWLMVAKVDAGEILAEARYRGGVVALFAALFIVLAASLTATATDINR